MNDLIEGFLIFFMLYVFLSVWVITNMLEKTLKNPQKILPIKACGFKSHLWYYDAAKTRQIYEVLRKHYGDNQ